jgi:hypothetical protein
MNDLDRLDQRVPACGPPVLTAARRGQMGLAKSGMFSSAESIFGLASLGDKIGPNDFQFLLFFLFL